MKSQSRPSLREHWIAPLSYRHVDIDVTETSKRQIETSGYHTDNRVAHAIQIKIFPQGILRTAKFPSPQGFADHGNGRRANIVLPRRECAAHQRVHSQHGKQI